MWITVRLLLVMSILLNLDTTQIEYTAAFVHASIDCLIYVECPKGFVVEGKCWKLKNSFMVWHKVLKITSFTPKKNLLRWDSINPM